jgi:hypothetical protein
MARNANQSRNEKTREPKGPAYIAYAVTEKGSDKDKKSSGPRSAQPGITMAAKGSSNWFR